jgi:hypothetical protein
LPAHPLVTKPLQVAVSTSVSVPGNKHTVVVVGDVQSMGYVVDSHALWGCRAPWLRRHDAK